jgi:transposase
MGIIKEVAVVESKEELRRLQQQYPSKHAALSMLLILKKDRRTTKLSLADQLGVSDKSISTWRQKYLDGGISALLSDQRGGNKKGAITKSVHEKLSRRLNNAREGFRSFTEIQQWLEEECKITMGYHAVNKYVKRKFGARLKVSRKSHVLKDPAAEAVFKKPV